MRPALFTPDLAGVTLHNSLFKTRFEINKQYVMSLRSESLLQNFHLEAGMKPGFSAALRVTMYGESGTGDGWHWGWESPTCEVRGHFMGHWLSAAARLYKLTGDTEIKLKADRIVSELGRCQAKNGGEWVGSIPEKYFAWLAQGTPTWAPQYVLQETVMGLVEMHVLTGNTEALVIAGRQADWFLRWTEQFSREQFDDMLDIETGAMLETWADLYGVTGDAKYLTLMERYTRSRLFDPLLAGEDVLTNKHANTTIPEAHGAARAYEVTGDERWRRIVEAYWHWAVTARGTFCTGGQTSGEVWTPPFEYAARLGHTNQEHCTVYNMIRLADYLFRWTGDAVYADYIERNLYNGLLAQQHPTTGMVCYYLPLGPGSRKGWGTPTHDFWCCHSTLVQAHTLYPELIYYEADEGITVGQYIPSSLNTTRQGIAVTLTQKNVADSLDSANTPPGAPENWHRPNHWRIALQIDCEQPTAFDLKLRLPWWTSDTPRLTVNGEAVSVQQRAPSFATLTRTWHHDTVILELPKQLHACAVPDQPELVAFMDGPVVLAGLCNEERALVGNIDDPTTMLVPSDEIKWSAWLPTFRTRGQPRGILFKPLYAVADEDYTVYFPVQPAQ